MKFKFILPILLFALLNSYAQAQTPSRITIKGVLQDTLHETIPFVTVMLLNPADSSLINFTTTNANGEFAFNNVKNNPYLFKVSHISFLPLQKLI